MIYSKGNTSSPWLRRANEKSNREEQSRRVANGTQPRTEEIKTDSEVSTEDFQDPRTEARRGSAEETQNNPDRSHTESGKGNTEDPHVYTERYNTKVRRGYNDIKHFALHQEGADLHKEEGETEKCDIKGRPHRIPKTHIRDCNLP